MSLSLKLIKVKENYESYEKLQVSHQALLLTNKSHGTVCLEAAKNHLFLIFVRTQISSIATSHPKHLINYDHVSVLANHI